MHIPSPNCRRLRGRGEVSTGDNAVSDHGEVLGLLIVKSAGTAGTGSKGRRHRFREERFIPINYFVD